VSRKAARGRSAAAREEPPCALGFPSKKSI
jgi:hypothetical protein